MQLPEQLRKQIELANQHYSGLENPEPAEVPAEPAQQPDVQEPAQPDAPQEAPVEQPRQPTQEPAQDATYWQHRFQTMQGKYNAEVPALHRKVQELEQALKDRAQPAAPEQAQTPAQAIETITQLSDEQLAEFGPETLAMVETLIQRRVGQAAQVQPDPELAQKLARLEQAEQQRQEERQQDAEARFWSVLHAQIPNLPTVNADAGFHQWLARHDPMTGVQRQQALLSAQQALDTDRVVAIFNSYFQETGQGPATKREVPAEQIQPQQSRSTATPSAEAKVWTGPEITQFYNDKARGRYSKEEAERIEADIFAATSSGRVR
ncbi:hypothetical protein ACT048_20675 [Ectopseudomonas khazarica]|uniref:hypothetical protein n=1 Tax=Ectopseudomonas khazarica TaxID=2502979 RepID=UPI004033B074